MQNAAQPHGQWKMRANGAFVEKRRRKVGGEKEPIRSIDRNRLIARLITG